MSTLRSQSDGFSFIELMIVIAIVASISAVAGPTLIEKRKGANEEAAIGALRTITTAQSLFREGDKDGNGVVDYAPTLHALATAGLIPPSLATGRDHGYSYNITATEDRMHWSGTAVPAAIDRSGDHVFATDDTEVEITDCPPGQHLNPLTGKCESDDSYVHDLGIRFIHSVDALSMGTALPTAKFFVTLVPDLTQQAAMAMDANHDGMLSFDEMLNPDLLGSTLRPLLVSFTDALRRDLALGVANEQLPTVEISTLGGDLLGFLNEVPPFVPGGASQ
jgi:prepilin-type N-terminal cleavage/methylation domain-containing protein